MNGYKIGKVFNNTSKHEGICNSVDTDLWFVNDCGYFEELTFRNIHSIVTKEQFEQMEYKVNG